MDKWPETTIDSLAKQLIEYAKSYEKEDWDELDAADKKKYGTFDNYMTKHGLDSAMDAGVFEELEVAVAFRARKILKS